MLPMSDPFFVQQWQKIRSSNSARRVNDKTTRNQWRSTEKLAPIREVFESIICRFQMAYTTNEHITTDEQLVVFRDQCPF